MHSFSGQKIEAPSCPRNLVLCRTLATSCSPPQMNSAKDFYAKKQLLAVTLKKGELADGHRKSLQHSSAELKRYILCTQRLFLVLSEARRGYKRQT